MPLAKRFEGNPILRPADVAPSMDGLQVECLLNPGAFRHDGKIGLLLRVAERPVQSSTHVTTPILDPDAPGGIRLVGFETHDPSLKYTDPRVFEYAGASYLTTLSHLRLAWSEDGAHFVADQKPTLIGEGELETYGIEDCRVTAIDGRFFLTYTAVSPSGVGVALAETSDWKTFTRHGLVFPPANKDCTFFPRKIGDFYHALHRPTSQHFGGNFIWLARSPDLTHWGNHVCLAKTRPGMWDGARVGAGAEPIETDAGWLEIYHGANAQNRYCLGALLLDRENPSKVIARSDNPIMEPREKYEQTGFFGEVIFTNGHVVDGDEITVYYGASDEVICGAKFSIREILTSLGK